jgi:hypothetical protein
MNPRGKVLVAVAALSLAASGVGAQPPAAPPQSKVSSWFGVPTPGPVSDWTKPTFAANSDAYGMPATTWAKPAPAPLQATKLMADVRTIVGFARERRDAGDLLYGRISGMPGEPKTVQWAIGRMKAAGIADAHTEEFKIDRPLYVPTKWEVRIKGDDSFGAGTRDVVLQSSMALPTSKTLSAPITGQLVFIGRGSPAELANVDLRGKIAVVNVVPDGSLFASREKGVAREAVARGAVGVINAIESPGNLLFYDSRYGCGDAPCYAAGGDDGAFLESVIGRAAAAGKSAQLKAQLSVTAETRNNLTALNGVATIPGKSKEIVIVNAHADSWFEGADDNADGLSVLVGLAEYYARRPKPDRTLVFMVSGGHHTGNGPAAFIAAHPEIMKEAVLVMNLEHLAQIDVSQGPRLDPGASGYRSGVWVASTAETQKQTGAVNTTPYVTQLMGEADLVGGLLPLVRRHAGDHIAARPGAGGAVLPGLHRRHRQGAEGQDCPTGDC